MYSKERLLSYLVDKGIVKERREVLFLDVISQHASNRRYWRLKTPSFSFIIMEYLISPFKGEEVGSISDKKNPYVEVQSIFKRYGIAVPELYYDLTKDNLLIIEDLGDRLLESVLLGTALDKLPSYYMRCIDIILDIQRIPLDEIKDTIVAKRRFDCGLLYWELNHFLEFGVEALEVKLSEIERKELEGLFDWIAKELFKCKIKVVHRDFQSKNIMIKDGVYYIIDFQDALLGPIVYDIVALLADSYIRIPFEVQLRCFNYFSERVDYDRERLLFYFYLQMVQRKLKDAGRFIFIDKVKKNRSFLKYFLPSLEYVERALNNLEIKNKELLLEVMERSRESFCKFYPDYINS